jgi:uncharacterized membrane protein
MTARRLALRVFLTTVIFAALDFLWLGVFMNGFYKTELGAMARLSGPDFAPIWWAALAVYAVLVTGLVVFVLPRAAGNPTRALGLGALQGLITYGTYDLTAYSVIQGWSLRMTLVDMIWGASICGLTCAIVTMVEPRLVAVPQRRRVDARQSA